MGHNLGTTLLVISSLSFYCHPAHIIPSTDCPPCPPGTETPLDTNTCTHCIPCPAGSYSPGGAACEPCSHCGAGLFELRPCNTSHDVFCELCSWPHAPHNTAFNNKCPQSQHQQIFTSLIYRKVNNRTNVGNSSQEKQLSHQTVYKYKGDVGELRLHEAGDTQGTRGSTETEVQTDHSATTEQNDGLVAAVQEGNGAVELEVRASNESVPVVGSIIAIITCGILFFMMGFFFVQYAHRKGLIGGDTKSKQGYHPTQTRDTELEAGPSCRQSIEHTVSWNPRSDVMMPMLKEEDEEGDTSISSGSAGYQSPVNIDPEEADLDASLEKNPLLFTYIAEKTETITNTGSTVKVQVDGSGSVLQGGPLGNKRYQLDHFHFHWGATDHIGSEHTVGGSSYSAEIHLVHWNAEEYSSFHEAAQSEDGLAVLAVFAQVCDDTEHESLLRITHCLPSLRYKGQSREVPYGAFDPTDLLPANCTDYWTYTGSLTFPPFHEAVTWIVFKQPIEISPEQIQSFRELLRCERDEAHDVRDIDQLHLVNNFHKPQPLEGRTIRASFL